MKNNNTKTAGKIGRFFLATFLASGMIFTACKKDPTTTPPPTGDRKIVEVSGTLSGNIHWSSDTIYKLIGYVRVGADDGTNITQTGILTIDAGTVIFGDKDSKGSLIIQRGSKIIAEGTAAKPIIFTSAKAVGARKAGDWGGLVLCGKAKNNLPGGVAQLEGGYGAWHGGTDDNDNSGILRYVRIEYAGIALFDNQEINSLTMGSVGRGTEISYIMATYGGDDSFEWFGGTVDCDHLVAYHGQDDDFDTDNGYTGNVQFGLAIRDQNIADISGSNAFESDNDKNGSTNEPFTSPTFSNMTIIGPKYDRLLNINTLFSNAAQIRRSSKMKLYNSFLVGFPNGIYIDGGLGNAVSYAQSGDITIKNTVLSGVENWGGNAFGSSGTTWVNSTVGIDSSVMPWLGKAHFADPKGVPFKTTDVTFNVKDWFNTPAFGNQFLSKWQDAGISQSIFELGAPSVSLVGGSVLLSGADFTGLPGFDNVAYRGAFSTSNWTSGWSEWNPNAVEY